MKPKSPQDAVKLKSGCPVIETGRLILRPLKLSDDQAILSLRSHPLVFKYSDAKPYETLERAQKFIKSVTKDIKTNEAYFWGITLKNEDCVIGTVCIWNFENENTKAEIGYELHPDYHHKGIMREALQAVLEFSDKHLSLNRIDGITHEANEPSKRILDYFSFKCLGRAIDIDSEIEEGPEMLLYRIETK